MKKQPNEILAGYVDVDAGLIMVGDPCYASIDGNEEKPLMIHNWPAFCTWLHSDSDRPLLSKAVPHPAGHAGAGIVVSSGFGDGSYPVYIRVKDCDKWGKRVAGLRIDFNV